MEYYLAMKKKKQILAFAIKENVKDIKLNDIVSLRRINDA